MKSTTIKVFTNEQIATNGFKKSAWFDAKDFDKLAVTLANDAAQTSALDVYWSHDGVTEHGFDGNVIIAAETQQRAGIVDVKARYFRLSPLNKDTVAPHNMTVYAYLKQY